jgi:GTPase
LFVVEALVKPHLQQSSPALAAKEISEDGGQKQRMDVHNELSIAATEQLRITLTGPTMSGKSTLLGTLTTSTLDNGRGKSRLSMLKHRHEITSGVTSSVTQELIGFKEADDGSLEVLNYATDTVVSWIDTHIAAGGDRLVFISDSAGHPRYRRTTIRGLVGWSPHWTLLCIPADDTEDTGGNSSNTQISQQSLGAAVPDMDLSGAQLDLCLRLHLPLVIVITKLDLASRSGLKASLTKVLDVVKRAGKHPVILKNPFAEITETELQYVDSTAIEAAYRVALPLLNDPLASVPIVLTSAVQGTGINTLQALLHELPIPENSNNTMNRSGFVFHIEDVYNKPAEVDGVIVSGLLRSGQISVGDTGALGPFSVHDMEDSEDSEDRPTRRPSAHLPTSRSFPGALRHQHSSLPHFQIPGQEWRRFRVNTIRNLRLPVHSLLADQVGTIAIVPDGDSRKAASGSEFGRIRKGMILTAVQPQAVRSFGAEFQRQDLENLAVGNRVVVYVCSVRAPAKVVSARALESLIALPDYSGIGIHKADSFQPQDLREDPGPTESDGQNEKVAGMVTATKLVVSFTFDATKEYVTVGEQVLVMPGGGPGLYGHERGEKGLAGLEGFVGRIVETCA